MQFKSEVLAYFLFNSSLLMSEVMVRGRDRLLNYSGKMWMRITYIKFSCCKWDYFYSIYSIFLKHPFASGYGGMCSSDQYVL